MQSKNPASILRPTSTLYLGLNAFIFHGELSRFLCTEIHKTSGWNRLPKKRQGVGSNKRLPRNKGLAKVRAILRSLELLSTAQNQ